MLSDPFLDWRLGSAILVAFGVLWVWLGRYWGRKARDLDGFMVAGRNVGFALGAAPAIAFLLLPHH